MLIVFGNRQKMLNLEWETVASVVSMLAWRLADVRGYGALLSSLLPCFPVSCDPLLCAGQF